MEVLQNTSLLFIDDDIETAQTYSRMLNKFIENVYTAHDGTEGYSLYEKYKPDIIVSDVSMPNLNGLDMVEKIRKTDLETKIIMLSAYSDKEKLLQAISLGLVDYLIKPIEKEKLKRVIYKVVDSLNSNNLIKLKNGYTINSNDEKLYDSSGVQVKLTKKELLIFKLLSTNSVSFFSTEVILNYVYQNQDKHNEKAVGKLRTVLSRLRVKLNCELIESIYGFGYRLKLDTY